MIHHLRKTKEPNNFIDWYRIVFNERITITQKSVNFIPYCMKQTFKNIFKSLTTCNFVVAQII